MISFKVTLKKIVTYISKLYDIVGYVVCNIIVTFQPKKPVVWAKSKY